MSAVSKILLNIKFWFRYFFFLSATFNNRRKDVIKTSTSLNLVAHTGEVRSYSGGSEVRLRTRKRLQRAGCPIPGFSHSLLPADSVQKSHKVSSVSAGRQDAHGRPPLPAALQQMRQEEKLLEAPLGLFSSHLLIFQKALRDWLHPCDALVEAAMKLMEELRV